MEIKKHHGILKPCVLKLYKFSNITILPLSKHEFIFLFYVTLFQMEVFGEKGLKYFLLCMKLQYSKEFLRFLCSSEVICELKSEWIHVYEESYIDSLLMQPLERLICYMGTLTTLLLFATKYVQWTGC
ncbi:unnamed protein product [Heterobilharzia americana]|nr:unnamed protein product [Heterobilharzia americana]